MTWYISLKFIIIIIHQKFNKVRKFHHKIIKSTSIPIQMSIKIQTNKKLKLKCHIISVCKEDGNFKILCYFVLLMNFMIMIFELVQYKLLKSTWTMFHFLFIIMLVFISRVSVLLSRWIILYWTIWTCHIKTFNTKYYFSSITPQLLKRKKKKKKLNYLFTVVIFTNICNNLFV